MRKLNAKQIGLIVGSLVVAFIINWLIWLVLMKHPGEIAMAYQLLVTICLGSAFIVVGDRILKTQIFK